MPTEPEAPQPMPTETPAAAPTRTPDEWALARFGSVPGPKRELPSLELIMMAGAKVHNHWVEGDQVTEAEFNNGWVAYATLPVGK